MQAARGTPLTPGEADQHRPVAGASGLRSGASRLRLLLAAVAVSAYAVDLGTKSWAVARLTGRPDVELVGPWLTLHLTRNPGAAFSTGTRYTLALSLVAAVAAVVVVRLGRRVGNRWWAVALGLLLGGVLGNLTDRVFREPGPLRGHVVDFLRLPHWPIFNAADVFINVAAAIIVLQAFRGIRIDGRPHRRDGSA